MSSRISIASELNPQPATSVSSVIGGGPLDGVYNDLVAITYDTLELDSCQSEAVVITGLATIPAGQTISVGAMVQHSDNGSDWDDFEECDEVVIEGPKAGAPIAANLGANLQGSKRYVRTLIKATTSSGLSSTNVLLLAMNCFESGMYVG